MPNFILFALITLITIIALILCQISYHRGLAKGRKELRETLSKIRKELQ